MAFWGVEVKPNEPYSINTEQIGGSLILTQATLGTGSSAKKTTLQVNIGDEKAIFICTLLPEKSECFNLNLEFDELEDVKFSVLGPTSIHISGYIQRHEDDHDDDCCGDDEEDIMGEMGSEDSEDESEDDYEDEDDVISDDDISMHPPSSARNKGVIIEEIEDEEKPVSAKGGNKQLKKKKESSTTAMDSDRKAQKQIVDKGEIMGLEFESEDEDGFPVRTKTKNDVKPDEESASSLKRKIKAMDQDQKPKSGAIEGVASEDKKTKKNRKKVKTENDETVAKVNQDNQKEEKRMSKAEKETKESKTKPAKPRTFANGLIIEELEMGKPDGKRASSGKKVSVHYIGKLKKTGAIFDSNITGDKPFKFRLGCKQVIKGWDVGVEGMRVGDKRRITIPPSMGYGAEGAPPKIPGNATLVFDVELVSVA